MAGSNARGAGRRISPPARSDGLDAPPEPRRVPPERRG